MFLWWGRRLIRFENFVIKLFDAVGFGKVRDVKCASRRTD
jgi:hypothetical protein